MQQGFSSRRVISSQHSLSSSKTAKSIHSQFHTLHIFLFCCLLCKTTLKAGSAGGPFRDKLQENRFLRRWHHHRLSSPSSSSLFLSPPNLIKQLTKLPVSGSVVVCAGAGFVNYQYLNAKCRSDRIRTCSMFRIVNAINPRQAKHGRLTVRQ